MRTFTQKHIIDILGLKRWQVQFYTERCLVEVEKHGGKGSPRQYSDKAVYDLAIIKELVSWGIETRDLNKIMQVIRNKKYPEKVTVSGAESSLIINVGNIISKVRLGL